MGKRYIRIAQEISSHYKTGMPKEMKVRICGSCKRLMVPGINAKVRLVSEKGYVAYSCECGAERHLFYR